MHLVCSLSFLVVYFNIYITASHLPGIRNVTADHLSRGHTSQAFEATPTLAQHQTAIPPLLFKLISPHTLDWTSPRFPQLFHDILSHI